MAEGQRLKPEASLRWVQILTSVALYMCTLPVMGRWQKTRNKKNQGI